MKFHSFSGDELEIRSWGVRYNEDVELKKGARIQHPLFQRTYQRTANAEQKPSHPPRQPHRPRPADKPRPSTTRVKPAKMVAPKRVNVVIDLVRERRKMRERNIKRGNG